MHFKSTINPDTKSSKDVPVTLFACNGKRLFMPRPTNFKTMDAAVRKKFHLGSSSMLEFSTCTLDICRGAPVALDEDVYETMSSFLDEIVVAVVDESKPPLSQSSSKPAAASSTGTPSSTVTASATVKKASTPKARSASGKTASVSRERSVFEDDDEDETPAADEDAIRASVEPEAIDPEPAFPVPEPRIKDADDRQGSSRGSSQQWVEVPPSSSSSAAVVEEQLTTTTTTTHVKQESATTVAAANLFDDEVDDEPTPPPRSQPSPSKFRPAVVAQAPVAKTSAQKPTSTARKAPAKAAPAKAKAQEERFTVHISGPSPDQEAEFKTRGGHLVRKVLAGACQNFGLDVEEARLYLLLQWEDEDGITVEDETECNPEDTMQKCGIEAGSRLVIRVDDEEYDEDE
ncbi:hypothetical protein BD626DRAFT_471808 [Schizophyllum amplum]|uniref:Uncharacterized protein n=1 Tax=Schizophyllum amplum TaxID=97359 RepID=A0A550CVF8_9AGAR|nr:hypothetical protein BD626DRAFT_471808 [Auriculariopsis ampla]